jgi:hypothetical protein
LAEEHRNDMELDLIESCSAFCMDDPHRFQEPSLNPSGAAPSPRVAASAAAVAAVLALVMAGFGRVRLHLPHVLAMQQEPRDQR